MTAVRVVRVGSGTTTRVVEVPGPAEPGPVVVNPRRSLGELVDVDTTAAPPPSGVPLLWRRDPTTGIYRLEPAPPPGEQWGDSVRFAPSAPTDSAPAGVVHVDVATGRVYRYEGTTP